MVGVTNGSPSGSMTGNRRPRPRTLVAASAVVLAAVLLLGWYFLIRDTSAASVDSVEAAQARSEALAEAATADTEPPAPLVTGPKVETSEAKPSVPEADTSEAVAPEDDGPSVGLDGTWTVTTSIGTFDASCLSDVCDATFVGFRIDEVLASIGSKTVIGRTPGVTGSLEFEGTTITAVDILIDMTALTTDDRRRTGAIRNQAISTNAFPEASFVLTEPIELGSIPADGESIQAIATGDFSIHGVTRSETLQLTAELSGNVLVVFGQLGPILLADYGIEKPSAAIVLSVEDNALIELQLFFIR